MKKKIEDWAIFQEVKENLARLDTCPLHDFSFPVNCLTREPIEVPEPFCKWRCRNCGGVVDFQAKQWYEKGLKARKA